MDDPSHRFDTEKTLIYRRRRSPLIMKSAIIQVLIYSECVILINFVKFTKSYWTQSSFGSNEQTYRSLLIQMHFKKEAKSYIHLVVDKFDDVDRNISCLDVREVVNEIFRVPSFNACLVGFREVGCKTEELDVKSVR